MQVYIVTFGECMDARRIVGVYDNYDSAKKHLDRLVYGMNPLVDWDPYYATDGTDEATIEGHLVQS
jgi:hypothetical protein